MSKKMLNIHCINITAYFVEFRLFFILSHCIPLVQVNYLQFKSVDNFESQQRKLATYNFLIRLRC